MSRSYAHPPITEAVIEFRFGGIGSDKDFNATTRRLAKFYPRVEQLRQFEITFADQGTVAPASTAPLLHKMISENGADIVLLGTSSVAAARLAPYPGWEQFINRFRDDLQRTSGLIKKRPLTRIGVRFINRIDVPVGQHGLFDHATYINGGLSPLPFDHGPFGGMAYSVSSTIEHEKFGFVLNVAKIVSPLVGRAGLLVDIEVANQVNLPSQPVDIWAQVDEIRAWKNRIFEALITDRARELFE